MKKIVLLFVVLLTSFGLAACVESEVGEFPVFDERYSIELSASEMMILLYNVDYTTINSESMRISVDGYFHMINENDDEDFYFYSETRLDISAVLYALLSEQVAESRMFAEGTIDLYSKQEEQNPIWPDYSNETSIKGDGALYFYNQYLYMHMDLTKTQDGEIFDAQFKEKYNTQITQAMWNEARGVTESGQLDQFLPIPQELLDLIENNDFIGIIDALPNLKVYKSGNTHSIVFSINKQSLMDSMLDIAVAVMAQVDPEMPLSDVTNMVNEAKDQMNTMIDELSFDFVISITDDKISKIAMSVVFLSESENIDIDMTIIIDMNVDLPSFPEDLDTYEAVDEPGQGLFD